METALGSFDFLNGSDWEEEEEDGDKRSRHGRSVLTNELKTDHPSLCTLQCNDTVRHTVLISKQRKYDLKVIKPESQ